MDEYSPIPEYNPEDAYKPEEEYEPIDAPASSDSADEEPVRPAEPLPAQSYPVYPAQPTPQAPYTQPQVTRGYYPPYPPQQQYPQAYNATPVYPQYPQYPQQNTPQAPTPAQPYAQGYPVPRQPQPVQQQTVQNQQAPPPAAAPQTYQSVGDNPYAMPVQPPQNTNPFEQVPPYMPQAGNIKPTKPPTPTGTKVFIIILCALLLAMVGGFIAYIAANAPADKGTDNRPPVSTTDSIIDDDYGIYDDYLTEEYEKIEDTITLVPDNGDTQKRSDDNQSSVGTPDEKAEDIKLNALPKDKDDKKYTTQSAYDSVCDSVVTVICYQDEITDNEKDIQGQGTGTIITKDGYIVTNAHVIANSRMFVVNILLNNGDEYPAKIIGYDTWTDLAVLKIDAKDLKPVTFGDSDLIEIGDDVVAIGSPGGAKFQNSLTKGIVSAVDRELSINRYVRYIQSDAPISPGNSGGPLCNIYGQVIGITTAKAASAGFESMSFSIPSETVEEIVGDLMHYGYVRDRARIGFSGNEISQEEIYYYGVPAGVLVGEIDENGALAGSGIKEGDIITEIDGEAVASFQDIYDVLANHKPGDKVTVVAERPVQ